jgi:uncharacterized protein (TIGR03067 family)
MVMLHAIHAFVMVAGLLGLVAEGLAQDSLPAPPGKVRELPSKDLVQKLQGSWLVVSLENGGTKVPEGRSREIRLVFVGDKLTITDPGWMDEIGPQGRTNEFTFTVDASTTPARIKLVTKGTSEFFTGGIFAFAGDTLRICHSKFANEFPTEFKSESKRATVLMDLRRVKKAEK